jgi:hypothetical protein
MTANHVGDLPAGCQSMATAAWGSRRDNLIFGGLGLAGEEVRSLDNGFYWDTRRSTMIPCEASLPSPRTQFQLVTHENKVYVIGGTDFRPGKTGGSAVADTGEILVFDPNAEHRTFANSSIQMPRPRRSFGATVVDGKLYLIGGLGNGFQHAGPCDVYDFATGEWSELNAPTAWVSPQIAAVGSKIYVACGGTMQGQRFTQDRSLWSYGPDHGWQKEHPELPFSVRHLRMLPMRNRLLFYATETDHGGRILLRILEPDAKVHVLEASFHR